VRSPAIITALVLAGCGGSGGGSPDADDVVVDVVDEDGAADVVEEWYLPGWIGSPCDSEADCTYADSVCLTDAPDGMCSLECDLYCPDRDGFPMTFCVDEAALPAEAPGFTEGACFSRCDYGLFPGTGCREGYGCVMRPRANESGTEHYVCVPGEESDPLTGCQEMLAGYGVSFEPTTHAPEHPDTHPHLTCTIEDPVILHPPILGVDVTTTWGPTPNILAGCAMALSLVRTIEDVAPHGVTVLYHMGTYNCRVVGGTDTLSEHAFANAIDIWGFEFEDGTVVSLTDHWEHDTDSPVSPGAVFLYEAAHRWFDAYIWNTILTPNFNTAHDDHFHVDLKDGRFMELLPGAQRYIGPAPYVD
jgi:hypothetical protein